MVRERQVSKIDRAKVFGHAQVNDHVLFSFNMTLAFFGQAEVVGGNREEWMGRLTTKREVNGRVKARTIGSCGTGLADISTVGSAATPPALSVHDT